MPEDRRYPGGLSSEATDYDSYPISDRQVIGAPDVIAVRCHGSILQTMSTACHPTFNDETGLLESIVDPVEREEEPVPQLNRTAIAWQIDQRIVHNRDDCSTGMHYYVRCSYCGRDTYSMLAECHHCHHANPNAWKPLNSGDKVLSNPVCAACGQDIEGLVVVSYAERMGKPFKFTFNEHRTYGIEIECVVSSHSSRERIVEEIVAAGIAVHDTEAYSHTAASNRSWIMKYDSSIRGMGTHPINDWQALEIVSPVLTGKAGFDELLKVCVILQHHCSVNASCGLHIHQGATDLSGLDMVKLYQQTFTDQSIYRYLLPENRRENHYCAPLRRCTNPNQIATLHRWGGVSQSSAHVANHFANVSGRASVNFCSFAIRGTIEFRMHGGTLDPDKIRDWVVFTQSMIEKARCTIQSFYRRFTESPTSSVAALNFLLFSRLGFPRNPRYLEGKVAADLKMRHAEISAGAPV